MRGQRVGGVSEPVDWAGACELGWGVWGHRCVKCCVGGVFGMRDGTGVVAGEGDGTGEQPWGWRSKSGIRPASARVGATVGSHACKVGLHISIVMRLACGVETHALTVAPQGAARDGAKRPTFGQLVRSMSAPAPRNLAAAADAAAAAAAAATADGGKAKAKAVTAAAAPRKVGSVWGN